MFRDRRIHPSNPSDEPNSQAAAGMGTGGGAVRTNNCVIGFLVLYFTMQHIDKLVGVALHRLVKPSDAKKIGTG